MEFDGRERTAACPACSALVSLSYASTLQSLGTRLECRKCHCWWTLLNIPQLSPTEDRFSIYPEDDGVPHVTIEPDSQKLSEFGSDEDSELLFRGPKN